MARLQQLTERRKRFYALNKYVLLKTCVYFQSFRDGGASVVTVNGTEIVLKMASEIETLLLNKMKAVQVFICLQICTNLVRTN